VDGEFDVREDQKYEQNFSVKKLKEGDILEGASVWENNVKININQL
jgi:hypothetical protein